MLKFGVYKLSQLREGNKYKGLFGDDKKLSISLHNQIQLFDYANEVAESILNQFVDDRGCYKRTYANRFQVFDGVVIDLLSHKSDENYILHDVGVSDAGTSVDFFHKINSKINNISYYASDYDPEVFVLAYGKVKVTLSSQGKILEICCPPFVFNLFKRDSYRYYPCNHVVQWLFQQTILKRIMFLYRTGRIHTQKISLFCPRAIKLAQKTPLFHLLKHDLMKSFEQKANVNMIRAMNILNPSYFTQKECEKVLTNIFLGLCENGFFVTGSNQGSNSVVSGGVYKKQNNRFKLIWDSGEGSPMHEIISKFYFVG